MSLILNIKQKPNKIIKMKTRNYRTELKTLSIEQLEKQVEYLLDQSLDDVTTGMKQRASTSFSKKYVYAKQLLEKRKAESKPLQTLEQFNKEKGIATITSFQVIDSALKHTQGEEINIRLFTYKSLRHYGGRQITTTPHTCKAKLIKEQGGHQNYVVELLERCAGFRTGHIIAVCENDYNIPPKKAE